MTYTNLAILGFFHPKVMIFCTVDLFYFGFPLTPIVITDGIFFEISLDPKGYKLTADTFGLFLHISKDYLGAVQVSRDQDRGRGGVCQMITLDHRGEGGSQPNDHMITHQGTICVFN